MVAARKEVEVHVRRHRNAAVEVQRAQRRPVAERVDDRRVVLVRHVDVPVARDRRRRVGDSFLQRGRPRDLLEDRPGRVLLRQRVVHERLLRIVQVLLELRLVDLAGEDVVVVLRLGDESQQLAGVDVHDDGRGLVAAR